MSAVMTSAAPRPKASFTTIAAITIGNGLEFFDFITYSFFAVVIGHLFFPVKSSTVGLMLALGSFGIAFLARPVGGLVLGLYADRSGRKPAMTLTLILMAVGSLGVALAPTYEQIGVWAPIWLVGARLIQGFSLGGEVGASTSLLLEYADDHSRGYFGSYQFVSQGLSSLFGAAVATLLTNTLSHDALYSWGWRIPFFIGVLLVPIGVYIRRHLDETLGPVAHKGESATATIKDAFQAHARLIWSGVLMVLGGTVATYIIVFYIPTYATHFLHMPLSLTLWASVTASAVLIPVSIYAGRLSDRVGRIPVTWWARAALVVLVVPGFMLLIAHPTEWVLIGVVAVLSVLLALQASPGITFITELYPRPIRATSLSVVYSVGVAVFGGSAQLIVTWLIQVTGSELAPAWYMIVATLLSSLPLLWLKETAGKPI
ncbi:MAG: MFS transporter [Burkholderiaceae bacterium]|nr:MAG: MFS transporter [Burkholderiaceae bacterium]